jgi:hypothetical protein
MKDNDGIASKDDGKSKLCNNSPNAITKDNVIASSSGL